MSADLRGFVYALEPLLRQRQWRVDAIQVRLGQVQRDIDDVRQSMADLATLSRAAGQDAARAFASAADAHAHARHLQWLVTLNARHAALQARLTALQADRQSLQRVCAREQRGLEAVEAHRVDCVEEYGRERAALAAAEADRDWLVRVPAAPATVPEKGSIA